MEEVDRGEALHPVGEGEFTFPTPGGWVRLSVTDDTLTPFGGLVPWAAFTKHIDDMKPTGGGKSVNLSALMKTNVSNNTRVASAAKVEVIKLGQDVHAKQVTVVAQLDGATPQPAQKIAVEKYLGWVGALMQRHPEAKVVSCYEAGPCGYWLHRRLEEKGVRNYVVAPQNWSGQRKTDSRDARGLAEALDRFEHGHRKAFGVVTVPSAEDVIGSISWTRAGKEVGRFRGHVP